jgi:transglutaminase-like putative cysteine protease
MTPAPARAASRATSNPGRYGPLVLSLSTVPALCRLIAHPATTRVIVPLVVAVVVADAVAALLRRRAGPVPAVLLAAVVAAVALVVSVDPSVLNPSSPHFFATGVLSDQLRAARSALVDGGTPLPLLSGVVVAVGALGGAVAAATRGIWARSRRQPAGSGQVRMLAPGLTPSLALFVYSTLVSAEQGRIAAALSYFLGVGIFVLLADRETSSRGAATSARSGSGRRPLVGAVAGGLLASAVVVGAGAGLSGMQLSVLHVHPPVGSAGVAPGDLLTGLALVDNLRATEITDSRAVIFRAYSPVATYWQVGTLSNFDGTKWLPTSGVDAALAGSTGPRPDALSPATLPSPPATQTFTAAVAITDFASWLLPAPPHALAVHGLAGATAVDEEGILAATPSAPGTSYRVTARLASTPPPAGPPLSAGDPGLAPYLALPAQPAVVSQLAHQAVGNARTPVAEAQALVDWFRSGRFRYTLSPPPTTGSDPLVQFLTVTRAGYCQQFAGAFGVLARSLGIPTRLVAGFTAGQPGPAGTYTVTGADAHVWPQVYLGPAAGWVSVEPTPPALGAPVAQGLLGPTHHTQSAAGTSSTTPTTAAAPTPTRTPTPTPSASRPAAGSRRSGLHHSRRAPAPGSPGWELVLVLAVCAAALLIAAALIAREVRRRRGVREAALHPDQRVVRSWERALGALRRKGMPRRAGETPAEYAARVRSAGDATAEPDDADAVTRLAALVELACYDPRPCTPGDVASAQHFASVIVTANRRHRPRTPAPAP